MAHQWIINQSNSNYKQTNKQTDYVLSKKHKDNKNFIKNVFACVYIRSIQQINEHLRCYATILLVLGDGWLIISTGA